MGSYSHITFNNYPIFTAKNSYRTDVVDSIFLPEDYISEVRLNNSRNKLTWEVDLEDDSEYTFKGYRQTAKICKQRLEIFGTKFSTAKKDFETARIKADEDGDYNFPIKKVTYKKYLDELRNILANENKDWDFISRNLKEGLINNELSIYGQSIESVLFSILSIIPEDSIVECDLSEVIENGWVEEPGNSDNIEKIIVLAEGKTDTEFISKALSRLYPHLFRYYHFIDFDEFKVESNASALAKLVIALTASNIKHPFIVLFDNDTTGIFEMKRLMQIKLPENIKVLKFPDIKLAKSYPTIGPTGIKKMNINGLACGIEMYFGHDVLMKNNTVIPIHWKAYNDREKQYQGEITEKNYVQEKFREKLKSGSGDFTDIKTLLNMIFNAFN